MKLSTQSHTAITSTLKKALERYFAADEQNIVTDIHLQPHPDSGELIIYNDDEEVLASVVVNEWIDANWESFYDNVEIVLKKALNQLGESGTFAPLHIMKPYSFVLVDDEKETVAELLVVDEEETMLLSDELLKGLDEELNAFLKDLLEK